MLLFYFWLVMISLVMIGLIVHHFMTRNEKPVMLNKKETFLQWAEKTGPIEVSIMAMDHSPDYYRNNVEPK